MERSLFTPVVRLRPMELEEKANTTEDVSTDDVSATGSRFQDTPMTVPTREHLDVVKRMMRGDNNIGRGSKSRFCNIYKPSGRIPAIERRRKYLCGSPDLKAVIWTLSGCRLLCHCTKMQDCHADILIDEFKRKFPKAFDRADLGSKPPSTKTMSFLAELRREPESDEASSADEGVPHRGSGF